MGSGDGGQTYAAGRASGTPQYRSLGYGPDARRDGGSGSVHSNGGGTVHTGRNRLARNRMTAQRQCEPGYYCVAGIRRICPAGRYGGVAGLSSAECSGVCARGHYCPKGTTSARANDGMRGGGGGAYGGGSSSGSGGNAG